VARKKDKAKLKSILASPDSSYLKRLSLARVDVGTVTFTLTWVMFSLSILLSNIGQLR